MSIRIIFVDIQNHGLLESRTGNFNITVKNVKTDALISAKMLEIVCGFF